MEVMRHRINSSSGVSNTPLLVDFVLAADPAHALTQNPHPPNSMNTSMSKTPVLKVASFIPILIATILLPVLLASCEKKSADGEKKSAQKSEDDFLDKDAKPDERKYLLAAKPFFIAVANRKYVDAHALLSGYARARMSLNQFTPAQQDADFQRNETYPMMNVTAEQFAYLMQYVEAAHGAPRAPKMLHVFSTDPNVLNRRSTEQFGAMDSMFAIGAMPDWIPAESRRASLRGQIHTELSPQELQNVAQREGIVWKT
jgi:hypothetical protein